MKKIMFIALLALTALKTNAQAPSTLNVNFVSDCNLFLTVVAIVPHGGCNNFWTTTISISGPFSGTIPYSFSSLTWTGPGPIPSNAIVDHIEVSQSTSCPAMPTGYPGCGSYPMNFILPGCVCNPYSVTLSGPPNNALLTVHSL